MLEYLLLLVLALLLHYNTELTPVQIIIIVVLCAIAMLFYNMNIEQYTPEGYDMYDMPQMVVRDNCAHKIELPAEPSAYSMADSSCNPLINILDLPPKNMNHYIASYSAAMRGENYLSVPVNNYKAPIYTGHPTNCWKVDPCVQNLEYTTYNNLHNDYNMEGPLGDNHCTNPSSSLMISPDNQSEINKNDGVNLLAAPSCHDEQSVNYYSMNRKQ